MRFFGEDHLFRTFGKRKYDFPCSVQAMKILADSWEAVTKEVVINCFKRAEINFDVQQVVIADSDNPFKDLPEN